MAQVKKSQLYSHLKASCDELRGGMDTSQYKDYILVLLFVRYISDKYKGNTSEVEIPEGGSFSDIVQLKGKDDIGEGINKVLAKLAEANELKGVIDVVDFNDEEKLGKGKEMVDRLTKLVNIFETSDLDFTANRSDGDDLLGDAYEYLMKNYAAESGKSKGQFYTPAEVSKIMAKILQPDKVQGNMPTAYDPACGSGSLLLKVAAETGKNISLYGQEKESVTGGLAMLNMWLHHQPTAEIEKGQSTLSNPLFFDQTGRLKTFDFVVANPPFSLKNWTTGFDPNNDQYERFSGFDIPPEKNGDYAWLLHVVKSLKSTGRGAVILPHGVLFRGNTEADIRRNLLERGYIKGIIGLPANLFFGTGIPACIILIDKEDAADREGIFMIDAKNGFVKDGNKNRLREQDIRKICDAWFAHKDIPHFARFVPKDEIVRKDYNLNIPRYIEAENTEIAQDLNAHLKGGIPNADIEQLAKYWQIAPNLKTELFKPNRKGYADLKISIEEILTAIGDNAEIKKFQGKFSKKVEHLFTKFENQLKSLSNNNKPKEIIKQLGDTLLAEFSDLYLLDKYTLYQNLMIYWEETFSDDLYAVVADGWEKAGKTISRSQKIIEKKDKTKTAKDIVGLAGLEGLIVPVDVVINEFFASQKTELETAAQELETATQEMETLEEEQSGDEGYLRDISLPKEAQSRINEIITTKEISILEKYLAEKDNQETIANNNEELFASCKNKDDKIIQKNVKEKIAKIRESLEPKEDDKEEYTILVKYLELDTQIKDAKKQIKTLEAELEKLVLQKYPALSEAEIKDVVIHKKWFAAISAKNAQTLNSAFSVFNSKIKELAERYASTLPEISDEVSSLEQKVAKHLEVLTANGK